VTVPPPCMSALSSSVASTWASPPGVTYACRPRTPITASLRPARRNAGSHSVTCCCTISSMPVSSADAAVARLAGLSSLLTTSASRSAWLRAAWPSSRTTSGSSAAAIISSSRIDKAVSGVRS